MKENKYLIELQKILIILNYILVGKYPFSNKGPSLSLKGNKHRYTGNDGGNHGDKYSHSNQRILLTTLNVGEMVKLTKKKSSKRQS